MMTFEEWWHGHGSGLPPTGGEDAHEHVHRVAALCWQAARSSSAPSLQVSALAVRLTDCAEDPMWADHAEVPKTLLRNAAAALEEVEALAGHYMAQRDEERGRMARAVLALGIAGQCLHAAANDQWPSFDRLSDEFDDAVAEVMSAAGAVKVTPESMRQAVAQADQMLAVDLCSNCLTPDACYLRGQCGHSLRERRV
jgi:hypothetical protein